MPRSSPTAAVAGEGSLVTRRTVSRSSRVTVVTIWPSSARIDTVLVEVSNNTALACPAIRCTVPAGAVVTGGDCAADAGVITRGSAEFSLSPPDEQPEEAAAAAVMTTASAATVPLIPRIPRRGKRFIASIIAIELGWPTGR
ncbi:Uncharacterised protein [Mycobacteroides abscessus subsp. abscessus]|nr:Uncharacterised protein [Mycobacteroides abscessus subsp. abscessus]